MASSVILETVCGHATERAHCDAAVLSQATACWSLTQMLTGGQVVALDSGKKFMYVIAALGLLFSVDDSGAAAVPVPGLHVVV